jgi:hypothetical protein
MNQPPTLVGVGLSSALVFYKSTLMHAFRWKQATWRLYMRYEIVIGGYIHETWFEGFTIIQQPDFTTKLRGHVIDQSALYGVLRKVNDLGLVLISVNHIENMI